MKADIFNANSLCGATTVQVDIDLKDATVGFDVSLSTQHAYATRWLRLPISTSSGPSTPSVDLDSTAVLVRNRREVPIRSSWSRRAVCCLRIYNFEPFDNLLA